MRFDILTLFPDMCRSVLCESITGRAVAKGIFEINFIDIRDFSTNKHRRVDDYPYGGGCGMVMQAEPVINAYNSIADGLGYKPFCIYMSPQGRVFSQETACKFAAEHNHIVLLCGHYEGIDERIIEEIVDMELSIGDYVLTGGEIPAMVVVDAVSRMIPGVLAEEASFSDESIFNGLLEYPQYTRPEIYNDRKVPDVLLSGHHANIEKWRREKSIERTRLKRPDLYEKWRNVNDV